MGCILALIGLVAPRVLMVFIWLLTDWFARAYETALWPILGFVFMPYTTLAFMGAQLRAGGVQGLWLVLLIVAVLVDLGHWEGGRSQVTRRRRRRDRA